MQGILSFLVLSRGAHIDPFITQPCLNHQVLMSSFMLLYMPSQLCITVMKYLDNQLLKRNSSLQPGLGDFSLLYWPQCFGGVARQHMVGARGGGKCSPHGIQEAKGRDRLRFQCSFQGHTSATYLPPRWLNFIKVPPYPLAPSWRLSLQPSGTLSQSAVLPVYQDFFGCL